MFVLKHYTLVAINILYFTAEDHSDSKIEIPTINFMHYLLTSNPKLLCDLIIKIVTNISRIRQFSTRQQCNATISIVSTWILTWNPVQNSKMVNKKSNILERFQIHTLHIAAIPNHAIETFLILRTHTHTSAMNVVRATIDTLEFTKPNVFFVFIVYGRFSFAWRYFEYIQNTTMLNRRWKAWTAAAYSYILFAVVEFSCSKHWNTQYSY